MGKQACQSLGWKCIESALMWCKRLPFNLTALASASGIDGRLFMSKAVD